MVQSLGDDNKYVEDDVVRCCSSQVYEDSSHVGDEKPNYPVSGKKVNDLTFHLLKLDKKTGELVEKKDSKPNFP